MNESRHTCHTCEWVMPHPWMSGLTHVQESHVSCHARGCVISRVCMSHGTHINEACDTYELVINICMCHFTHTQSTQWVYTISTMSICTRFTQCACAWILSHTRNYSHNVTYPLSCSLCWRWQPPQCIVSEWQYTAPFHTSFSILTNKHDRITIWPQQWEGNVITLHNSLIMQSGATSRHDSHLTWLTVCVYVRLQQCVCASTAVCMCVYSSVYVRRQQCVCASTAVCMCVYSSVYVRLQQCVCASTAVCMCVYSSVYVRLQQSHLCLPPLSNRYGVATVSRID